MRTMGRWLVASVLMIGLGAAGTCRASPADAPAAAPSAAPAPAAEAAQDEGSDGRVDAAGGFKRDGHYVALGGRRGWAIEVDGVALRVR